MKLIFNGQPLFISGGIGVYTHRILTALAAHKATVEFKVLIPAEYKASIRDLPLESIEIVPGSCPFKHSLLSEIWWQQRIGHYASTHFPDDTFMSCTDFFSFKRPNHSIITIHDGLGERRPNDAAGRFSPRRLWRRLCRHWAARATKVLTVSSWSAQELIFLGGIPAEKVHVVHSWLDNTFTSLPAEDSRRTVREKHNLPPNYWLYLGGFRKYKNVSFLLRAYAQLVREAKVTPPPLVIAGKLPVAAKQTLCEEPDVVAKQLGLTDDQVKFIGAIEADLLPALYAECSLFIFPSLYEGFGFTPLEAAAMGAPVIAARAASMPEVLNPHLCCFSPDRIEELIDAMKLASKEPDLFRIKVDPYYFEPQGIARWIKAVAL
jgi:glycosyltransferase involved in cell wall biosynthesis